MLYLLFVYRVCNLNVVDTNAGDKIRNADCTLDPVNASSLKEGPGQPPKRISIQRAPSLRLNTLSPYLM